MADFAQGLDASKLILAETVRPFQLCGICGSPQLTHTHHIAALLRHQPIHSPSIQFPPLSLWYICAREPRSGPSLTPNGMLFFSSPTFI
jgi:hypothetical protein